MLEIAWDALAQEFASVAVGLCSPGSCMATGSSPTCQTSPQPIWFEIALRGIRDLYGTAEKSCSTPVKSSRPSSRHQRPPARDEVERGMGLSTPVQRSDRVASEPGGSLRSYTRIRLVADRVRRGVGAIIVMLPPSACTWRGSSGSRPIPTAQWP